MKEIALKSILLQFLRRKKLFSLLILFPLLLGMAAGALRSRSSAGPSPGTGRGAEYQYMKRQYDALVSLKDSQQQMITDSILLNMDPAKVAGRRHTFFLEAKTGSAAFEGDLVTAGRIGNYYAYYKFTAQDYAAFRQILGKPELAEIYIDELVGQAYNSDLGLLTLAALHPDQAVADRLGEYNYERVIRLYSQNPSKNHTLLLIGDVSLVRTDESISQRLNDRITAVAKAQEQIDALGPRLAAMEIVPDLNRGGDLAGSILTWGLLGLLGGLALALVVAAVFAGRGDTVYDTDELGSSLRTEVLGFIPGRRMDLAERLVFGPVRKNDQYERVLSRLGLELRQTDQQEMTLVSPGNTDISEFLGDLQRDLPLARIRQMDRLDRQTLPELRRGSLVLLAEEPSQSRVNIREHMELIRKSGSEAAGIVFVS